MFRIPSYVFRTAAALTVIAVMFVGTGCMAAKAAELPRMQPPDAAGTTPIGPYYALVIGNDDYQYLPKLKTATNDATALAHVLHEQYGFSTTVLLNATRADIIEALLTYRRKLPEKSSLLIYYAGHGANDSEARVAYWLPVDAQLGNTTNWISADDITSELRVIKSLHVLVVADSCYSGALTRGADFIDTDAEMKPSERDYYLEKLQGLKSRNVLSSGGVEPVADGGALGHSIFAAVMLQSLKEIQLPEFSTSSLFQRVVVRVAGRSQQTPQYSPISNSAHDGGDFVFFRQPGSVAPPELCCSTHSTTTASVTRPATRMSDSRGAEQEVTDVLGSYKNAYENEDVDALKQLWPGISQQSAKSLQSFFATAKTVTLNCALVGSPQVSGDSATITFNEQLTYSMDGKMKAIPPHKTTMKLSRSAGGDNAGGWKIESMK